jgi:hypothetical protein
VGDTQFLRTRPIHNVDISAKMLYDVSRLLPPVKGAEKMKSLVLLLKRGGVLIALALSLVLDAHASVTVYAVWYPNGDNSPPQVVQNGATIGGWFYLCLRLQPQMSSLMVPIPGEGGI